MAVEVGHADYWMPVLWRDGMSVAEIRRTYQSKLGIPPRAVAVLNGRTIHSSMEFTTILKDTDKLVFLTQQEIYVWKTYKDRRLPLQNMKFKRFVNPEPLR